MFVEKKSTEPVFFILKAEVKSHTWSITVERYWLAINTETIHLFSFCFLPIAIALGQHRVLLAGHHFSHALSFRWVTDWLQRSAVQRSAVQRCLRPSPSISCLHRNWSKPNRITGLHFYLWKLIKQRRASTPVCKCLSGSAWLIQLHLFTAIMTLLILWNNLAILATHVERRHLCRVSPRNGGAVTALAVLAGSSFQIPSHLGRRGWEFSPSTMRMGRWERTGEWDLQYHPYIYLQLCSWN